MVDVETMIERMLDQVKEEKPDVDLATDYIVCFLKDSVVSLFLGDNDELDVTLNMTEDNRFIYYLEDIRLLHLVGTNQSQSLIYDIIEVAEHKYGKLNIHENNYYLIFKDGIVNLYLNDEEMSLKVSLEITEGQHVLYMNKDATLDNLL